MTSSPTAVAQSARREDYPAQDEGRSGRRRTRGLLAAVPGAAAAAGGVRPACVAATGPARLRGGRRRLHLRRPAGRRGGGAAAAGRLRSHHRLSHHVHDRDHAGPGRPADRRPDAAAQPAAHRVDGSRELRHGSLARLLRRLPAAGDRQRVPALRYRLPLRLRLPRGRPGLGQDRELDRRGRRAGRAQGRPPRADGSPVPGHDGRLHRSDPGLGPARRPCGDPGDRRPLRPGRPGHRRRDGRPDGARA